MKLKVDHSKISFDLKLSDQLSSYANKKYIIKVVDIRKLRANIAVKVDDKNEIKLKKTKIANTPHYAFLRGNKKLYSRYLHTYGRSVGYGIEHSVAIFQKLTNSFTDYLDNSNKSNYIVVKEYGGLFKNKVILDGVHRAAILLDLGFTHIPVAILKDNLTKGEQLKAYLNDYKDDFLEWYTPLSIDGNIINERTYPEYVERPEYLNNKERGKSKWDFIIKKNLPSIKNKKVYDIGCNSGFFSILLKQAGAKSVIGVDRTEEIFQPTNKFLPRQNVVQQAYFVKNLYSLALKKELNKIKYIEKDINHLNFSKLKCDFLYATCILYHFGEERFEEIIKQASKNIPEIFLQSNLGHTNGELGRVTRVKYQKKLLEKYGYRVKIDAPPNYNYPIIYGKKKIKSK